MYVGFDFLLIIRVGLCVRQCQVWWTCMKEVSSLRWRCVAPFRVFSKAATFSSVDEAIRIVHIRKHTYTPTWEGVEEGKHGGTQKRETGRREEGRKKAREARGSEHDSSSPGATVHCSQPSGEIERYGGKPSARRKILFVR